MPLGLKKKIPLEFWFHSFSQGEGGKFAEFGCGHFEILICNSSSPSV